MMDPTKPNEFHYVEEVVNRRPGFDAKDIHVTKKISQLINLVDGPGRLDDNRDLVKEIIVTALKTQKSHLDRGDVKILNRALRELRYGFHVFKPYRNRQKVTIFGSARSQSSDIDYKLARAFAQKMARKEFMVITGAGPGIMKAGNEGAGRDNSFGVNIRLPFEQKANQFIQKDTLYIDCRFFFTRKLMFLKEASAVALFPGGFGTYDEGMEVLTLVQTGKCDPIPIVFIEPPGSRYWSDWKRYVVKHLLKTGKISAEDMNLFMVTDSVDKAVREIVRFYRNYHSLRYVKDLLVIRLKKPVPARMLKAIHHKFEDICYRGEFMARDRGFPEETQFMDLPRLAFHYNRFNFGRLRELINFLNSY